MYRAPLPYALLIRGGPVLLTESQFRQAYAARRLCRCGTCLCCHVREYAAINDWTPVQRRTA